MSPGFAGAAAVPARGGQDMFPSRCAEHLAMHLSVAERMMHTDREKFDPSGGCSSCSWWSTTCVNLIYSVKEAPSQTEVVRNGSERFLDNFVQFSCASKVKCM